MRLPALFKAMHSSIKSHWALWSSFRRIFTYFNQIGILYISWDHKTWETVAIHASSTAFESSMSIRSYSWHTLWAPTIQCRLLMWQTTKNIQFIQLAWCTKLTLYLWLNRTSSRLEQSRNSVWAVVLHRKLFCSHPYSSNHIKLFFSLNRFHFAVYQCANLSTTAKLVLWKDHRLWKRTWTDINYWTIVAGYAQSTAGDIKDRLLYTAARTVFSSNTAISPFTSFLVANMNRHSFESKAWWHRYFKRLPFLLIVRVI